MNINNTIDLSYLNIDLYDEEHLALISSFAELDSSDFVYISKETDPVIDVITFSKCESVPLIVNSSKSA